AELGSEPVRLRCALLGIAVDTRLHLRRASGDVTGEGRLTAGGDPRHVGGELGKSRGRVARRGRTSVARPRGTAFAVRDGRLVGPTFDPAQKPAPFGDELAALSSQLPVELDFPELLRQPVRQVFDPAGMNAADAKRGISAFHPPADRPRVAAEGTNAPRPEALVPVHGPLSPA